MKKYKFFLKSVDTLRKITRLSLTYHIQNRLEAFFLYHITTLINGEKEHR